MRPNRRSWRLAAALAAGVCAAPAGADAGEGVGKDGSGRPRVFLVDPTALAATKARAAAGEAGLAPALAHLCGEADKALKAGPFSVVDKAETPPSGDKHDYMSIGPYWWPDPAKTDGLPYVRRDGEVNPDRRRLGDADRLGELRGAVVTLATAYYFTGREPCADRAAKLLRTWFLDEPTRMNPNLQYAQAVPGHNQGRGIGIVDTAGLIQLIDAVGMLGGSSAWTDKDEQALRQWFGQFLSWLRESRHGKDEAATRNNHSTQYDAQVAAYALFVGREDLAREVLRAVPQRRIAAQIEPDGSQPLELARTKSWDYSCGNLRNFCHLALLGERVGADLWSYETADGRSIRKALDYLLPYATGEKKWAHKQIARFDATRLAMPLRLAALRYRDPKYDAALARLPEGWQESRDNLLYPPARTDSP